MPRQGEGPDHLAAVTEESRRFADCLDRAGRLGPTAGATPVPTCPDWSFDDLVWHLSEVQHFWAAIVEGPLDDPAAVEPLDRPPPHRLPDLFRRCSGRLVAALERRADDEVCWSWHPEGHRVGWVRRRQAHEALIHRVDAELTLAAVGGPPPAPIDEDLALDGIDELVRGMLDVGPAPAWGAWFPDGTTARLEPVTEGSTGPSWDVDLGRVAGTDRSGVDRDLPALRVRSPDRAGPDPGRVDLVVRAPAGLLDRWLWGRAPLDSVDLVGDPALAERLREVTAVD
jgi:hypothetical protein